MMEIEKKKLESELVNVQEIEDAWVNIVTVVRTKLLGIPTKQNKDYLI